MAEDRVHRRGRHELAARNSLDRRRLQCRGIDIAAELITSAAQQCTWVVGEPQATASRVRISLFGCLEMKKRT